MRAAMRKPSSLISWTHCGPAGGFSTSCESWGGTKAGSGASRLAGLTGCEVERLTTRGMRRNLPGLIIKNVDIGGSGVGLAWWLTIPVVLLTGAIVGSVNGFLIVRLRLNAFIVTLAMLILLRGVQLGTTSGKTMFDLPGGFLYLGSGKWIGIPVSIWIAAILYVVFGLFLRYHRLGRALYAIGGNVEAARVAGVRVDRVLWGTFIVAGVLAALAGLMLTGRIASVVPSQGQNMIFYVFAAAVIGGISLNGGKGRLLGALTGVLLLGILQNVLTLAEIPAFWIDAIILIALVVS